MNSPKLIKVRDYLKDHKYDIVPILLMAADGDYEILRSVMDDRAAWDLLAQSRSYGELTKLHTPADFPIALSSNGLLSKKVFRLAGLLLSGQEHFLAVETSLPGLPPEKFKLSKEDREKVDAFYEEPKPKPVKSDPPKPPAS